MKNAPRNPAMASESPEPPCPPARTSVNSVSKKRTKDGVRCSDFFATEDTERGPTEGTEVRPARGAFAWWPIPIFGK